MMMNVKMIATLLLGGFFCHSELLASPHITDLEDGRPVLESIESHASRADLIIETKPLVNLVARQELMDTVPATHQKAVLALTGYPQWLMVYMNRLGCSSVVLHALYQAVKPSREEIYELLIHPNPLVQYSDSLSTSIQKISQHFRIGFNTMIIEKQGLSVLPPYLEQLKSMSPQGYKVFNFSLNRISDLKPLKYLDFLVHLDLSHNRITDLQGLEGLSNLQGLYLDGNQLRDISLLAALKTLNTLQLDGNQIVDVTPLANLQRLMQLYLNKNLIVDVQPLENLDALLVLGLHSNPATDTVEKQDAVLGLFKNEVGVKLKPESDEQNGTKVLNQEAEQE